MFEIVQDNLSLLKLCLVILFLVPFPTLAFYFGGSFLSLCLSVTESLNDDGRKGPPVGETVQGTLLKKSLGFLILVLVAAAILLVHLVYRPPLYTPTFWSACLAVLAAGFVLMHTYGYLVGTGRRSALAIAIGIGGFGFLNLGLFLLFCGGALLFTPEKWPFLAEQPRLFFSWAGVAGFLQFFSLSLAVTGTALLLEENIPSGSEPPASPRRTYPGRSATVFLVTGLLLWPPLALFEIIHLPDIGLSPGVFALFVLGTFLAWVTCRRGLTLRAGPAAKAPMALAITLMGVFLCSALAHHLVRESILRPAVTIFPPLPNVTQSLGAITPTAAAAGQTREDSEGARLFQRSCGVCHAFDRRVVGPPLNSVLSKYQGRSDKLRAFIANPVKIDPNYPSMPRLGLPEEDIRTISAWLLEKSPR